MLMTAVQLTWCSTGHLIVLFKVLNVSTTKLKSIFYVRITYCNRDTSRFQQNSTFVTKNMVYLQHYWIRKEINANIFKTIYKPACTKSFIKFPGEGPNNVFLRGFYRQPTRVIGPPDTNYIFFTCYQTLPLHILL